MTSLLHAYQIPLIVALLIGVAIAWWIFARRVAPSSARVEPSASAAPRVPPPATADVAGEPLRARVQAELPRADGPPDNLQILKGVGPKLAQQLKDNGIARFDQLARLSESEVQSLEEKLGAFKGRLTRDRVVEQAQYLARGDKEGFQARFGNLGGGA